jgi:hypothetical protein
MQMGHVHLRSLLMTLAVSLMTVAPFIPHPYDRLVTGVAQLLRFAAELVQ